MTDDQSLTPVLNDMELIALAKHLRGMTGAKIRFVGDAPEIETAIINAILELGISVESEHIADVAPSPQRRFSFRYEGSLAIVTVALRVPADHY